jgi:long-chain fatty acid transport protein
MRKLLTFASAVLIAGNLFSAGLVTNTNQSAAWVRMPSRNASTGIDAVYYNPAGLTKLEDGFHFSLNNQTIFQTKTVNNNYKGPDGLYGLNTAEYVGDVKAPVFPGVYAVYKKNRFAFSLGFNPVGGGGGATYSTGLPSFEMSPSDLVPSLASQGATAYRLDAYLKGSSVYFGLQGGVSYKVNDMLSLGVGLRYVMAKNTYTGHLTDIEVNMGGTWMRADDILNGIAAQLTGITTIPAELKPAQDAGYGGATLDQLVAGGGMSAEDQAAINASLAFIGVPPANIPFMTVNQISGTVTAATPTLQAKSATYGATAELLGDQNVDATQKGSGISPIFSLNFSPVENVNLSVKYEMRTKMDITNSTKSDFTVGFTSTGVPITMFPDGEKTPSDMPALLSIGLNFKVAPKVGVYLGSNYFFDKNANYGHKVDLDINSSTPTTFIANKDIIDQNGFDLSGGLEVNLSDKLLVSAGYLWANKGVNRLYQSDLTFACSTNTVGFGGQYTILKNLRVNLGASITSYKKDIGSVDHVYSATNTLFIPTETRTKSTWLFGIGVDYSF